MGNIAVLLTCFNRKDMTIQCLSALHCFQMDVDIYLVDDNSTDNTAYAISCLFPNVKIIKGSGDLFWSRGMYLAWDTAIKTMDYDYYIWMNDDVVFYNNCLNEIFECSKLANDTAIISGIIETEDKLKTIYGGSDEKKKIITPNGKLQPITNMNGNVVLIPKAVYEILGNLDPKYHHDLGDVDYGLRAKKNNINVYTTRVAVGSAEKQDVCRVRLCNATIQRRFKKLYSPLGSPPFINFYFRKRHYGLFNASKYFLFIQIINVLPDNIVKVLFGNKYI